MVIIHDGHIGHMADSNLQPFVLAVIKQITLVVNTVFIKLKDVVLPKSGSKYQFLAKPLNIVMYLQDFKMAINVVWLPSARSAIM